MMKKQIQDSLVEVENDPLIRSLKKVVVFCVKCLAILMVFVIFWGTLDVVIHLYQKIFDNPTSAFNVENMINILGTFLAVLVAIEIFLNIVFYLKRDVIHVPLVVATALTAVARKVIVMDYGAAKPFHTLALAAIVLSLGLTYWLITKKSD